MLLTLNEEQAILRDSAQAFFNERLPVKALRALRDAGDRRGHDPAAWREMAAMGWAGILVPERHGGVGFGYVGCGVLLEAGGRTLAASPLVSTALTAAPLLVALGSEAQQAELLPAVAAGERLLALAIDEGPRHAPHHCATRATSRSGGWRLEGRKVFVVDGQAADYLLVVARTSGTPDDPSGLAVFLVPADAPGLERRQLPLVDSRGAADVVLHGVDVGGDALLGPAVGAWPTVERVLDGARAGLAAELLGLATEAFERTLAYLKLRQQFGVPIGSFQALKHRAAQMFCELELTRSAVLAALGAQDAGSADAALLASLAKTRACDTAELVTCEAIQMHGGIGMTDAEDIGLFIKRARVVQQLFGDAVFHRDRYARLRGY